MAADSRRRYAYARAVAATDRSERSAMGFYNHWVVPRILNLMMGNEVVTDERKKCLMGVTGKVLEVGFGSGHNLPWYPDTVQKVVAVDPSTEGAKLAKKRIAEARFPVEYVPLAGEDIAAPDASFDSVVSTFTLCSIPDPVAALDQMLRVLKPGGKLFLVEHGRSPEPKIQRWQDRLNRVQNAMCGGCNMNRDIRGLVAQAGFVFEQVEQYYMPKQPKLFAFVTRGVARRANA
jgi:ubiquinone/menaquinone biosynthesis C-methylase UbiE